jgi:hypothetical protein
MAEKIKDEQDRFLESLFAAESLADDGFSAAIVAKVKRRLWLRRMLLPAAAAIGGSVAINPLAELVRAVQSAVVLVPVDLVSEITVSIPRLPLIIAGAMLLVVCMLGAKALQD